MILKAANKTILNQIAGIFCTEQSNPSLCEDSLYQRLLNELTDYAFENSFLPNLSFGRHYILQITKIFNAPTGEPKTVMEYQIMDLVTGEIFHAWEDTAGRMPNFSKVPSMLGEDGLVVVSQNKTFSASDFSQKRIVYKINAPSYGIVYVPGGVGGSGGTGGTGGGGGQVQVQQTPTSTPIMTPTSVAGFDLQGLLSNPIVWIAGGGLLLFYLMKK